MSSINSNTVDYGALTKMQKLAIFLIAVGPQAASSVMKNFDDKDVETICREISEIKIIDSEIREKVFSEFTGIIGASMGAVFGGVDYAQKALELWRGDSKAASIIGKLAPGASTADALNAICEMEPMKFFNLVRDEQSQTIAYLTSQLGVEKIAEILKMFEKEKKEEILEYMGAMGEVPVEMLNKIVQSIKPKLGREEKYNVHRSGGVRLIADVLNLMDKEVGKSFLARLKDSNPELGAAVSKKMFSFEDLLRLSIPDLQRVSREIEMSDLVLSLKTASKELEAAIMKSISKRAAESLKEELAALGPVKVKDVDAAQERIIQVVRRLEEEGAITLDQGGGDVIK